MPRGASLSKNLNQEVLKDLKNNVGTSIKKSKDKAWEAIISLRGCMEVKMRHSIGTVWIVGSKKMLNDINLPPEMKVYFQDNFDNEILMGYYIYAPYISVCVTENAFYQRYDKKLVNNKLYGKIILQ